MGKIGLPTRLKGARELLGLTIKEAAQKLGFQSYQTLIKIEAGEREVRAYELSLFEKTYFVNVSELLGFKKSKKEIEIEIELLYHINQYCLLERLLNIKTKKANYLSDRFISLAVSCLRKGLISRGKFAEMVSIDHCDIDEFILQSVNKEKCTNKH